MSKKNIFSLSISKDSLKNLMFLLSFTKIHKTKIIITIIAMVGVALSEPAIAYLFKLMIDDASIKKNAQMIILVPFLLIAIFFVRSVSSLISIYLSNWIANSVIRDLRELIFNHFLRLKQSYLDKKSASKVLSKVTYDVEQVSGSVVDAWVILIKDSLSVLSLLGLLLYLNFQLSLIIFIGAPVIIYVFKYLAKRIKALNLVIQQIMGSLTQITDETLNLLKLIKIFGTQSATKIRFNSIVNNLRAQKMKVIVSHALNVAIVQMVVAFIVALVIYLALKSAMSTGDFVAYTTAVSIIFSPIKRISGVNAILQKALAALDSIENILNTPTEKDKGNKKLSEKGKVIQGKIEFKNICFNYSGTKKTTAKKMHANDLFKNLNLSIKAGQIVAIVGTSGSGKSSLVQLLLRLYELDSGKILIDDIDISKLKLSELRLNLSYVEQTVLLFNGSIRENIKMANQSISDEKIIEALKKANAYDFIFNELAANKGLDTKVGDRGSNLSGGQRQRIAIARALVNPSPILILDEATSALDNHSETKVQQAIFKERKGKTTIIIAHRLSSIKNADCIFVVNQGKIAEIGSHNELIKQKGIYANLYLNKPAANEKTDKLKSQRLDVNF